MTRLCAAWLVYFAVAFGVALAAGCSSPTAPSETSILNWDVTATGCQPKANPPKVAPVPDLQVKQGSTLTAIWVLAPGRNLTAEFHDMAPLPFYGLCAWE